ncbi:hypothetical protein NKDENANG_01488 [Candidatus Entotheonellaceae bacterium PAL068K]
MIDIRLMLVAVDLSDISVRVIDYAHSLATAWNARLLVVHVVHDLSYYTGIYITDIPLVDLQHRLEAEARTRLEAICQTAIGDQVLYDALLVTGRPVAEIHRLIHDHGVECLVIGAHSAAKPEHQLFGSTAQRLLHQIPCPVLVIPPRPGSEGL